MLSSKGEIKIHNYLEYANIPFEEEYIFPDLKAENGRSLRFDFAVFDDDGELDCLIEYNGVQHYVAKSKFGGKAGLARQQHNDTKKRQYCLAHNIRLITIPYTEEDSLTYDYLMKLLGY